MAGPNFAGIPARTYNALLGAAVRYRTIPALAGAGATGVALTIAAGPAWSAYANLAAAKAITTDFWIVGVDTHTIGVSVYELQIANATPTVLDEWQFEMGVVVITAVGEYAYTTPFLACNPFPIFMVANSQVQARIGGSAAAKAATVSMKYAIGL